MLTSKTFVRKTKKGSILKVVREHYLRDDIWCGSQACDVCERENAVLQESPTSHSDIFVNPHYIIPDTNVVLHQIDVLEDQIINNVIILQTVLDEVRHRSPPIYARLKDLINNKDRCFYSFTNEHHKDTYIERQPGESANDRNDRAIRVSTNWYAKHLRCENASPVVILITNDRENKNSTLKEKIKVITIEEYISSFKSNPGLLDRLAKPSNDLSEHGDAVVSFAEYISTAEIHSGIKSGKFLQGTFIASRENFLEGYVSAEGHEKMILIQGRKNLNRAVHDDHVAIEILPKDQWSAPSDVITDGDNIDKENEAEIIRKSGESTTQTAKVVGIIKRNWRQYCGMLRPSIIPQATKHLFVPAEKRIPKIRIETRQVETMKTQRIVVVIDSWPRNSRYPLGHFVRTLGEVGDKATENEVLLLEHDIPHQNFSKDVLDCLPELPWLITDEDWAKRVDLREVPICSVDPPGCTDIDDALHCRILPSGLLEVGVHIADVSHFIRPGTAIDKEAADRGTTVYLVDKRIDMVPELLSSNLCSLRENEERFAFSCIWEITENADVVNVKYHKSIIKSKAAFTYEQAQMRIDDKSQTDEISEGLRRLNRLAKIMKKRRKDAGALVLASLEVRFSMDDESHDPIDIESKQLREANSMVEEFMLLANVTVARKIHEEFSECALLRRHPSPPASNFEQLVKAAVTKGFQIVADSGKELADCLDECNIKDDPYFNTMLRMLATRSMMQAVYFCSGMIPESEYYHYGLAANIYTHFTSPIRRYSDVIVHRLLAAAMAADSTYPDLLEKRKTQVLCNNLNFRHKMAQYAGRASVELHTQLFFKEKILDEEGYVLFVKKNAIQVLIPKFGLQGNIFLDTRDSDVKFTYDEQDPSHSACGVKLCLFDRVIVQISIDRRNLQHQRMLLKLVEPKITGFSVDARSTHGSPSPKKKKIKN